MPNTTSLEWSKKLKEVGIVIETEKYWSKGVLIFVPIGHTIALYDDVYPSPTVTELMDWGHNGMCVMKVADGFRAFHFDHNFGLFIQPTPQDALAQLFIYIKENGLYDTRSN